MSVESKREDGEERGREKRGSSSSLHHPPEGQTRGGQTQTRGRSKSTQVSSRGEHVHEKDLMANKTRLVRSRAFSCFPKFYIRRLHYFIIIVKGTA